MFVALLRPAQGDSDPASNVMRKSPEIVATRSDPEHVPQAAPLTESRDRLAGNTMPLKSWIVNATE